MPVEQHPPQESVATPQPPETAHISLLFRPFCWYRFRTLVFHLPWVAPASICLISIASLPPVVARGFAAYSLTGFFVLIPVITLFSSVWISVSILRDIYASSLFRELRFTDTSPYVILSGILAAIYRIHVPGVIFFMVVGWCPAILLLGDDGYFSEQADFLNFHNTWALIGGASALVTALMLPKAILYSLIYNGNGFSLDQGTIRKTSLLGFLHVVACGVISFTGLVLSCFAPLAPYFYWKFIISRMEDHNRIERWWALATVGDHG